MYLFITYYFFILSHPDFIHYLLTFKNSCLFSTLTETCFQSGLCNMTSVTAHNTFKSTQELSSALLEIH